MVWHRWPAGGARSGCSSQSVPRVGKLVVHDRDARLLDFFLGERLPEEFTRQFGQQRVGDDVIDHPPAGAWIVETGYDVLDDRIVIAEGGLVIVAEALSDPVELQSDDSGKHLVRKRKV